MPGPRGDPRRLVRRQRRRRETVTVQCPAKRLWRLPPLQEQGAEAKRAFDAMMTMTKIDVAAIEAARRG